MNPVVSIAQLQQLSAFCQSYFIPLPHPIFFGLSILQQIPSFHSGYFGMYFSGIKHKQHVIIIHSIINSFIVYLVHIPFFLLVSKYIFLPQIWASQGGASGKESAFQCWRCKRCRFDSWVEKIPWRRRWQPTPVRIQTSSGIWLIGLLRHLVTL